MRAPPPSPLPNPPASPGAVPRFRPCSRWPAGVPPAQQAEVFTPTPRNTRRAIFATNLAETSLTIEGVVYVVDTLHSKQRAYDPLLDLDSLLVAPVTRASAKQRAGRAGRVRPGHCFRLCTQEAFEVRSRGQHASPRDVSRPGSLSAGRHTAQCNCGRVAAQSPGTGAVLGDMGVHMMLCVSLPGGSGCRAS